MAATLATMTTRVQTLLMDTGAAVWDTATITEGIRLAVGEYSLAGKTAVTLSGLDAAVTTTVPLAHESMIAWGSSAYAALSRAADRAETFQLGSEAGDFIAWGEGRLKEFKSMLGFIFPGYLAASSGGGDEDPAKLAAEIALLNAQVAKVQAETANIGSGGEDPGKLAAEIALLAAQAEKVGAEADAVAAGVSAEKQAAELALLQAQSAKVTAEIALLNAQAANPGSGGEDPDKLAAEIALIEAQTAASIGQEARAAAAAAEADAAAAAKAARLAEIRTSDNRPWGTWQEE